MEPGTDLPGLLDEAQSQRPLLTYLQEENNYQQFRVQMREGETRRHCITL